MPVAEIRSLYLIRHGQTEWNVEKRLQGGRDSPLTALGRQQAEALAGSLADTSLAHLHASSLGRASETALIIANALDVGVEADPRLGEMRFGEDFELAEIVWHGLHARG